MKRPVTKTEIMAAADEVTAAKRRLAALLSRASAEGRAALYAHNTDGVSKGYLTAVELPPKEARKFSNDADCYGTSNAWVIPDEGETLKPCYKWTFGNIPVAFIECQTIM